MTAPIIDRDAIIEKAARALVEHDADRMTCYDHMGACCPAGGCAHGFTSRTGHQAAVALPSIADDLLAPIVIKAADWVVHAVDPELTHEERAVLLICIDELRNTVAAIREAVRA